MSESVFTYYVSYLCQSGSGNPSYGCAQVNRESPIDSIEAIQRIAKLLEGPNTRDVVIMFYVLVGRGQEAK